MDSDLLSAVIVPVRAGDEILFTVMDAEDAERLGDRRLSLGSHGYPQMFWDGEVMLVHRWILGLKVRDKCFGDHINREPFDNRRINLRVVSASGSSQNVSGRGKSPYRGVHPVPSGRFMARVKFRGRHYILGTFDTELEAANAADLKRRELMPQYVPGI